ncbi:unnamed protein product [Caenorhabditis nigoni]
MTVSRNSRIQIEMIGGTKLEGRSCFLVSRVHQLSRRYESTLRTSRTVSSNDSIRITIIGGAESIERFPTSWDKEYRAGGGMSKFSELDFFL